jgi:hypothetical protein
MTVVQGRCRHQHETCSQHLISKGNRRSPNRTPPERNETKHAGGHFVSVFISPSSKGPLDLNIHCADDLGDEMLICPRRNTRNTWWSTERSLMFASRCGCAEVNSSKWNELRHPAEARSVETLFLLRIGGEALNNIETLL